MYVPLLLGLSYHAESKGEHDGFLSLVPPKTRESVPSSQFYLGTDALETHMHVHGISPVVLALKHTKCTHNTAVLQTGRLMRNHELPSPLTYCSVFSSPWPTIARTSPSRWTKAPVFVAA